MKATGKNLELPRILTSKMITLLQETKKKKRITFLSLFLNTHLFFFFFASALCQTRLLCFAHLGVCPYACVHVCVCMEAIANKKNRGPLQIFSLCVCKMCAPRVNNIYYMCCKNVSCIVRVTPHEKDEDNK